MFFHLYAVGKDVHEFDGNTFEIEIYKTEEDGHLRGYISSGEFNDVINYYSIKIYDCHCAYILTERT